MTVIASSASRAGEPAQIMIDRENPWPGLESFPEGAEAYFHGRDRERDELLRLIRRDTLTLLFGQSGLGKTSLLRAGLFPLLPAEKMFPVYIRLDHSENAPAYSDQILVRIKAAAQAHHVDAPARQGTESLWEYLHRSDAVFWSAKSYPVTPVLTFDQFEELFTQGLGRPECAAGARQLLEELRDLIDHNTPETVARRLEQQPEEAEHYVLRDARCKVVLSLREDFLPELDRIRDYVHSPVNRLRLLRMNGEQALEAITQTGGHLVDDQVAHAIVRFLARAHGGNQANTTPLSALEVEPALLSVFCRELNERRKQQNLHRIGSALLQGAQEEILGAFYDRSMADLDPGLRRFVEEKLLTDSGYRNSIALEDAVRQPGVTLVGIQTLVNRRLLRLEERFGTQRVELTHDVLSAVARERRDRHRALEAAEAANRALLEAERQKKESARRSLRRVAIVAGLCLIAALVSAALASRAHLGQQVAHRAMLTAMAKSQIAERSAETAALERARREAALQQVRVVLNDMDLPAAVRSRLQQLTSGEDSIPTGRPHQQTTGAEFERAACSAITALLNADTPGRSGVISASNQERQALAQELMAAIAKELGQSTICARAN